MLKILALIMCSFLTSTAFAYKMNYSTNTVKIYSVDDYNKCARDFGNYRSQLCLDGLTKYIKKNKKKSFDAAEAVLKNHRHFAALPFFKNGIEKTKSKEICKSSGLVSALDSGLAYGPKSDPFKTALEIVKGRCWPILKKPFLAAINKNSKGRWVKSSFCQFMESKSQIVNPCLAKEKVVKKEKPHVKVLNSLNKVKKNKLKIDSSRRPEVYVGYKLEKFSLVPVTDGKNKYVLVKIENINGDWNNTTHLHLEYKYGEDKIIATQLKNGKTWRTIQAPKKYWGQSYTAYIKGQPNVRLSFSGKDTKKIKAKSILKNFKGS